jgi:hypothetical protein
VCLYVFMNVFVCSLYVVDVWLGMHLQEHIGSTICGFFDFRFGVL